MIISEPNDFVADVFGDPMPSRAVNPRVQGPTRASGGARLPQEAPSQLHSSLAVTMPSPQAGVAGDGVVIPALVAAGPPFDP